MTTITRRRAAPWWPLALASLCHGAGAQTELPAVTVTANKQAQALDAVPAGVTVHEGEVLEAAGITSLRALEEITPGLSFQPFGQSGIHSPVVRGLSANFFSFSTSTLLLVDGVPTLMAQGFDNSLLAIDRVEVLRGPQSTLYGRNAEAGVINIHTLAPGNAARTMLSTAFGSRGKQGLRLDLSRPLVEDTLYASVSGSWTRQRGFIDNTLNGGKADDREQGDARFALRWTPDRDTDATLRYAQQTWRDGAALWGAPAAARATVASGTPSWNHSIARTLSLDVSHAFASGLRLRSITARNEFFDRVMQDTDFRAPDTLHIGRDHRFQTLSQELRLEGSAGASQWLAGLYLDRDDHDLTNEQKLPLALTRSLAEQKGRTVALFTHWSVPLSAQWKVEAGARIERNELNFTPGGQPRRSADDTRFSPKLALQYQATPDSHLYASVSEGFRAGGFNVFVPAANYAAFAPETVRSFEIGTKGTLLQRRLRYAAALYRMNVRDMQVQQMPTPGVVYITNAASATSTGAEFELDYLLATGWRLQSGLAFNRTRFGTFRDGSNVYDGHRNPFAPDLNGHVGLRYDAPKGWHVQATLTGTGKVYLDAANRYSRNGFGLLNLSAGKTWGAFELSAYVHNLADRRYDAVGYQNGIVTVYSPPREVGMRLTWRM